MRLSEIREHKMAFEFDVEKENPKIRKLTNSDLDFVRTLIYKTVDVCYLEGTAK